MSARNESASAFVARVLPCNCYDTPSGDRIQCVLCQVRPLLLAAIMLREQQTRSEEDK